LKKGKKLQEDVIARYIRQMLEGLDYLHTEGVVHCDIKCANILVTRLNLKKIFFFFSYWFHKKTTIQYIY